MICQVLFSARYILNNNILDIKKEKEKKHCFKYIMIFTIVLNID